jgi:DNA-binding NtrC family response regulator
MEPKILMIGRRQEVVDILVDELKNFGRDIVGASEQDKIEKLLQTQKFDFVVIGAGLPDHQRDFLTSFIESLEPGLPVHMIERKKDNEPFKLVNFTNKKAVSFKIDQVSKKKDM